MDPVEQKLQSMTWRYAEDDARALKVLEKRIAAAGRSRQLINYSDLVRDVPFDLVNLRDSPRTINVNAWQDLDRDIIGSFLGFISMRSYERGRFFASALVVSKDDGSPGKGFFDLLNEVGAIDGPRQDAALMEIWLEHVNRAYNWFSRHHV